jgi:hypothetical protein
VGVVTIDRMNGANKAQLDEFDESFQYSLAKTIQNNMLPTEMCTALKLDNHSTLVKSKRLRRFIYDLNRAALTWICDFNRINFLAPDCSSVPARLTRRQKLENFLHCRNRTTSKLWPKVIAVVWFICVIKVSFELYFNYIYHANNIKLQKLRAYLNSSTESFNLIHELNLNVDALQQEFEAKASEALRLLDRMGCSFVEWSFFQEAIWVLAYQTLMWYFYGPWAYHIEGWNWLTAKSVLDKNNEAETRFKLTLNQLRRFSADSRSFVQVKLEQFRSDLTCVLNESDDLMANRQFRLLAHEAIKRKEKYLRQRHEWTIKQLKTIALEGRLNPPNRTPQGRDKLALQFMFIFWSYTLYGHLIIAGGYISLILFFSSRGKYLKFTSYRDFISFFAGAMYIEVAFIAAILFVSLYTATICDQLQLQKHLKRLVEYMIDKNEIRRREILLMSCHPNSVRAHQQMETATAKNRTINNKQTTQQHSRPIEFEQYQGHARFQKECTCLAYKIESDLITIILQGRLSLETFALVKRPVCIVVRVMLIFAVTIPVVMCLHSPYYSPGLGIVSLYVSFSTNACCLLLLSSCGLLYRRTVKTFETFWSLVAQLSHLEMEPVVGSYLNLDSSVSLFIIRRTLADSQQSVIQQFLCRGFSMPITYTNLLKVFAWTLLFMMAGSIMTVRLFGEGLAAVMSDPFGLFKFMRTRSEN